MNWIHFMCFILQCHYAFGESNIHQFRNELSNLARTSPKQSQLKKHFHFCGNTNFKIDFKVHEVESCCINGACAKRGESARIGGGGSKNCGYTLYVGKYGKQITLEKWGGGWGGGNCNPANCGPVNNVECMHNIVGVVINDIIFERPILKGKYNPVKGTTLEFELVKEQTEKWSFSEFLSESDKRTTVDTVIGAVSSSNGWDFNLFKFGNSESDIHVKTEVVEALRVRLSGWTGEFSRRSEEKQKYKMQSGSVLITMSCCRKYPITLQYDGPDQSETVAFEECIFYAAGTLSCEGLWGEETGNISHQDL
eukprot:147267_1